MHDYHSRASRTYVLICGIFFILCNGTNGQTVTCNSMESATSNVFETYDVTVSGVASNYTLNYEPAKYGPGMRLPLDTTEVTVTAVMSSSPSTQIGNCTFNVTVNLNELPIACPQTNDVEPTDAGEPTFRFQVEMLHLSAGFNFLPYGPIFDELSTNTTGVVNDHDLFAVGTHAVSVRYFDDYLEKFCNFTLTVVDTEPPIISCPEDIVSDSTNAITYTPRAISDNVPDPMKLQESITYSPDSLSPGSRFPLGISTITISLSDVAGNQGNCSFDVTVTLDELPIVCPPQTELTVGTDPGQPFYTYPDPPFNITYPPESMTYMPYGSITMVRQYGSGSSSNNPRLDTSSRHLVTIVISDGPLQKSCNEATVTVEDREPPTIVCPDDIFQTQTKVGVNALSLKNLTDNSGGHESTAIEPFILPGGDFPVGTTTYTFTAFDAANNNASCSFNVTVELAPTPTPPSTEANATPTTTSISTPVMTTTSSETSPTSSTRSSQTMVAESTTVPQSTAESTSRIGATAGPQGTSDNLPIIIGCSVAGAVLLIIIIFLAICCSSPGRRAIFGIGPKEPVRIRHVGASRHGVATDPVLLNDRLERTKSNIYASTEIDGDVDMAEDPEMMETGGATGGYKDPAEMNGMHVNDAYEPDDGMMMAKSVL